MDYDRLMMMMTMMMMNSNKYQTYLLNSGAIMGTMLPYSMRGLARWPFIERVECFLHHAR